MKSAHRVVVLGGGFGGLYCAKSLRRADVDLTLIDRRNFHLFQPLLYQVATGGLSPANIAVPLRAVLRRQRNARVLMAEATGIDVAGKRLLLADGDIPYDTLVVATGSTHHHFGHNEWEPFAPGLKTVEDATAIRHRILYAFEAAEREHDPMRRSTWLSFVVVGAGPTGVELAGTLGEMAHYTLRHEFRSIDPTSARILLVEGHPRVLPHYPEDLSAKAQNSLERLGVTVKTSSTVVAVTKDSVTISHLGQHDEQIATRCVFWAAGVQASPLGKILADATGGTLDKLGRVCVEPNLTLPGHPEIFVIGDLAHCVGPAGQPLPGVAPVAMQQGRYVARLVQARKRGRTLSPFRYRDLGNMATIGRAVAVADFGWIRFGGMLAWLAWLFVHLTKLIQFQNRLLVLSQWAWSYFTRNRAARLITGDHPWTNPKSNVACDSGDCSTSQGASAPRTPPVSN